ncbi:hypothetical protein IT575_14970 [bacterium]|nr:hypothetical protein [bacterium]
MLRLNPAYGLVRLIAAALLILPACAGRALPEKVVSLNSGALKISLHGRFETLSGPNPDTQPTLVSMAAKGAEHWQGWRLESEIEPLIAEIELAMKQAGYSRMQPPGTPALTDAGLDGAEKVLSLAYGRRSDSSGFIIPMWDFSGADWAALRAKKGEQFTTYFEENPVGLMIIPIVP